MSILIQCSMCEEDFASLRAFDDHILSKPSDPIFDCMSVREMTDNGFIRDRRGRWLSPEAQKAAEGARMRFGERPGEAER